MLQSATDVGTTADFGRPLSMTSDESPFQPADTTSFGLLRMAVTLQDILKHIFGKLETEQPIRPRISEQDTPLLELIEALKERTEMYLGGTIINVSTSFPVCILGSPAFMSCKSCPPLTMIALSLLWIS